MPQPRNGHSSSRRKSNSPNGPKKRTTPKNTHVSDEQPKEVYVDVDSCCQDEVSSIEITDTKDVEMKEDDDEEAWLDALEKGDLDDYGELKKEKDPSLLTARQKAMQERTTVAEKPATLNVAKVESMSEEAQRKKAEKNKKRKLQAVRKAEESQKLTIERLVKQQGGRGGKDRQRRMPGLGNDGSNTLQPTEAKSIPMIKYHSKGRMIYLSFPENQETIKCHQPVALKPKPKCVVCSKPKLYNSSKTKMPVCSLECYRQNLSKNLSTLDN